MPRYRATLVALALFLAATRADAQRPDSAMVGAWQATGRITVDWTQQRELEVRIAIQADGSVAGTVGDATLLDAHLFHSRTFLQRTLRLGTDYVIEGALAGPILRMEDVLRAFVRIPLNWDGTTFSGTLRTNGTVDGSREAMRFTASDLVFHRAPTIISALK